MQRKQAENEKQTAGEANGEEAQFQECCEWPENEADAGIAPITLLEPTSAAEMYLPVPPPTA